VETAEDPEKFLQSIRDARSRMALSRVREAARESGASRMTLEQINQEISAARKVRKN
jgi:hypothetical protein